MDSNRSWGLDSLLEGECVMPVQFAGINRGDARPPEHRLLFAVLEDAVRCWQLHAKATDEHGKEAFAEVAGWFASDDDASPFAFVNICQLFRLEPAAIRDGLRRWAERSREANRRVTPFRIRRIGGVRHLVGFRDVRLRAQA